MLCKFKAAGGVWGDMGGLPGLSVCHSPCWGGLGGDSAHPRGSTRVSSHPYTHLAQGEKRIKLFAFQKFSTEFDIQNNKVPKEEEAILS